MTTAPLSTSPRTVRPTPTTAAPASAVETHAARRILAVFRVVIGLVFLWPFFDKAFGLGFATPSDRAWINGGTPSQGYLRSDGVEGPAKDLLASMASPLSDWLFMLGMLGVGLALILGIGLRIAAAAGAVLMLTLYVASWPFNAGSQNPLVDQHLVFALAVILLAALSAGDTWGLGRPWAALVGRHAWLR